MWPATSTTNPQAATTQILHGPPGSEVGTGGIDRPDTGAAQRLWNTAGFIDEAERWSRVYRGRRELIDHVWSPMPSSRR
ncbi:hypothetical protein [Nocardioides sp.]|uniref:hypothetical protein n=1 Tax=Nocardioides sp. TaxID=35761 RepID=UPI0027350454|nr:hypothetical protein [Nocardioides sp.]MDP3891844.1 hypothetical protein [Nocardioides sp.]